MYIPSFALSIYNTTCHAKPYLCYLYRSVPYRYLSTVCVSLASLINDKQHDDDVRGCTAVVGEMMKNLRVLQFTFCTAFLLLLLLLLLLVVLLPSVRIV